MHDAITAASGTAYDVEQSFSLYPTSGASDDYAYSRHFVDGTQGKILSFTVECVAKVFQDRQGNYYLDTRADAGVDVNSRATPDPLPPPGDLGTHRPAEGPSEPPRRADGSDLPPTQPPIYDPPIEPSFFQADDLDPSAVRYREVAHRCRDQAHRQGGRGEASKGRRREPGQEGDRRSGGKGGRRRGGRPREAARRSGRTRLGRGPGRRGGGCKASTRASSQADRGCRCQATRLASKPAHAIIGPYAGTTFAKSAAFQWTEAGERLHPADQSAAIPAQHSSWLRRRTH